MMCGQCSAVLAPDDRFCGDCGARPRPGDYFGEMALIDRGFRSATITAETELCVLLFTAWVFRPFAMNHPEATWALLEIMVQRVRDAESR